MERLTIFDCRLLERSGNPDSSGIIDYCISPQGTQRTQRKEHYYLKETDNIRQRERGIEQRSGGMGQRSEDRGRRAREGHRKARRGQTVSSRQKAGESEKVKAESYTDRCYRPEAEGQKIRR
ncbi:MAG: hypothetical protein ABIN18_29660 [Pseudomonadota bacterium]